MQNSFSTFVQKEFCIFIKMKKRICFTYFLLCALYVADSQNLVPNSSFEIYTQCPGDFGFIYKAPPWFQPCTFVSNDISASSSSDLFDTCGTGTPTVGIPTNDLGYQPARTGHGYAGIYLHYDTTNWREYIEVPLLSTLIQNKRYCIEFYVSLAETSQEAVSNIGVYFSVDSLLDTRFWHPAITSVLPQFENPITNMLTDKTNWMQIAGYFIAAGGEKYMTIGNFHSPANTNFQNVSGGNQAYAYYYIDDISLTQCNVGVEEMENEEHVRLYPNPATNELTIESKMQNAEIEIRDVLGQMVYNTKAIAASSTIDVSMLSKGVYFISLQNGKQTINKKLVKE